MDPEPTSFSLLAALQMLLAGIGRKVRGPPPPDGSQTGGANPARDSPTSGGAGMPRDGPAPDESGKEKEADKEKEEPGNGEGAQAPGEEAPAAPPPAEPAPPRIDLGPDVDPGAFSEHTRQVLEDILRAAGVPQATVTSTARTPDQQASAMYDNCARLGSESQRALYAPAGDQVVDVFDQGQREGWTRQQTVERMTERIREVGPERVSRHAADPRTLNVVDVDVPDQHHGAFEDAVRRDPRVQRMITPPNDPVHHLEIPQPPAP